MKKLPLKVDAIVMSECWTYFRMAIIETSPYKDLWLAAHFRIFSYHDFSVMLGENGRMHPMNYFADILSFKEIPVGQVNSETLVEIVINEMQQDRYVILDCNYPKLFTDTPQEFYLHEVYLFGFDENKEIFYGTVLQSSGRFEEVEIPFKRITAAFADIPSYFSEHSLEKIERQCSLFTITSIQLKDSYRDDNSVYLFLQKIQDELNGSKHVAHFYDKDGNLPSSSSLFYSTKGKVSQTGEYYTGLACLLMIRDDIGKLMGDKEIPVDSVDELTKSLKKFHEHQSIIQMSMEWFMRKLSIDDASLAEAVRQYKECCEEMSKLYLMSFKFQMTRDKAILKRIQDQLLTLYREEYAILSQFETMAKLHYCENQRQQLQ